MYTRIYQERLYERIAVQIERRIVGGDLTVGQQLPPEMELAKQFGVSRTAVREAIKALREKGLVEVQPGRGTFVKNNTLRAVRDSLALMAQIGQAEGQANLVEVRELFEPEIAALAAVRATDVNVAALREAVDAMDAALNDAETFIEADLDFHLALAEAIQNTLVLTLIDSIIDLLREQRARIFFVDGGPQRGQFHHKRILDAVIRRDAQAAREAMRAHLRQVRQDTQASIASAG